VTKKVLIANRGEIAIRIARAARELGWEPITIYAPDDAASPHVRAGSVAFSVPSYTDADAIIEVGLKAGADIVHPGYGFLSEDPHFARKVLNAGMAWAGPDPKAMEVLGDKKLAKEEAEKAGVPTLPWCEARSEKEAVKCAEKIGFPVILKASKAGGGRGLRVANTPEEVERAFKLISFEADRGFGKGSIIFVEKYIKNPRHIEVQILGDTYGNIIHLYERECSLQRRKQKIIEEAPSPYVERNPSLRSALTDYALRLAEAVKYHSAGTVEFVVNGGKAYFIEANTRLQVEHGITEAVTGVDIVKLQLLIADDKELNLRQEDVKIRGWAIEARIYAEDPERGFTVSEGVLTRIRFPHAPGIRIDHGIEEGLRISGRYDTLLAKIISWGSSREEAVARLRSALMETVIAGVKTNLDLLRVIVDKPWFRRGEYHTNLLENELDNLLEEVKVKRTAIIELISALRGSLAQAARRLTLGPISTVMPSHGWPWPPWK
jgi:acetyl/propionyl-CoA carboxylase alpha subunit